jgi:hypothetical protein
MKKLLSSFAISSVLLLIGCQENSITDPIQDSGLQKYDNPLVHQGKIELEGILVVPGAFQTYYSIEGQINYTHELVLLDPIPPAPQQYVSLRLNVNADLRDPSSPADPIWTITSNTEDIIYVSEEGIYLLYKTFSVLGREDGLALVCRFLVSTDGIGLSEMLLVTPEDNSSQITGLNKSKVEIKYPPVPPVRMDKFE